MSHLLRISLPDVPGSLGAVATALGMAGADIEAIEIVEHRRDGTAVDDVFLELPAGVMPDMVVSAVQKLEGVRVLWVSRYAAGGNFHLDLEAIEVITEDPTRAVEVLTELVPQTFRSDWAMVVSCHGGHTRSLASTSGAPRLPGNELAGWFPLEKADRPVVEEHWEGWTDTDVAAAPFGSGLRVVLFGRHGGPEILDSELFRLNHLATLAASIETTLDAAR